VDTTGTTGNETYTTMAREKDLTIEKVEEAPLFVSFNPTPRPRQFFVKATSRQSIIECDFAAAEHFVLSWLKTRDQPLEDQKEFIREADILLDQ